MAYGTMSIGNAGFTKKFISTLFLLMHPKGAPFFSDDPTSPAELYGGTWERIEDCTIWGASDTHPAGTKLEAGLPNIVGSIATYYRDNAGGRTVKPLSGCFYDDGQLPKSNFPSTDPSDVSQLYNADIKMSMDASRSNPIYGRSDTVQPPAYCMYIWRRVA